MRPPRRRSLHARGTGLLAAVVGAGILLAGLASGATDTKPFTATVSVNPDANTANARADAWAGATPTITISITNDADPQTLGSANITIPAGIVPDPPLPTGNVIQLRNLNLAPHATTSVSLTARIPCVPDAAGYPWVAQVKQSNDFNGTGNDFTPATAPPRLFGAGVCSLAFTTDGQPTSAQRLTNITADPYFPGSTRPVAVRVADGSVSGTVAWWTAPVALAIATNPGSGTLSGTTSATPVSGTAQFLAGGIGPQIDRSAAGYRLTASSAGVPGTAPLSSSFDIVDSGQRCHAGQQCSGTASNARFSGSVTTTATLENDLLLMSLGAPDEPVVDCPNYAETTDILAFDVTTLTGGASGSAKTITFTILNPVKSAAQYDVCFRAPAPFTAKSLAPAPVQTDGSYVALLPDCRRVSGVAPCVTDRARVSGTVVLTFTAPPGDPKAHF